MGDILDNYSEILANNSDLIKSWFDGKRKEYPIPIYGSVDVRDSGFKVGVVDSNHFPAGFNNVEDDDLPQLSKLIKKNIERTHSNVSHVHIYPESHTRNPAYVENVMALRNILQHAGYRVTVGSPTLSGYGSLDGLTGPLVLDYVFSNGETIAVRDVGVPDLVLLNNDLTEGMPLELMGQPVLPDPSMGWHKRRKSSHFRHLGMLADEICNLIGIDPWLINPIWMVSEEKCLEKEECLKRLVIDIDDMLEKIQEKYDYYNIDETPCVFVKNDRGTYGLGIIIIEKGEQLLNLSNRKLHKLTYGKGGALAENFLIQEGIPTSISVDNSPSEPVAYLVDGRVASWFYRLNHKKGRFGNLNSPSAKFIRRSDTSEQNEIFRQDWYQLVAELSMLAMGAENLQDS